MALLGGASMVPLPHRPAPKQPPNSLLPSLMLAPFVPPHEEVGRASARVKWGEGHLAHTAGPPQLGKVSPGVAGHFTDCGGGGGDLGARWRPQGSRSPCQALVPCCVPLGGHASPLSICFGALRHPLSGATGTPWWPLTATSTCLGAQPTTLCPMSYTAMMWTFRPGRSSSPVRTAR